MANEHVKGLAELYKKMDKLGKQLEGKAIRSSLMSSTLPVVREMQAAAPRGKNAHRTYKGRLVAPGFLSRSVKRKSRINKINGTVSVLIGVQREAYYGVTFLDKGLSVSSRKGAPVTPYKITGARWFQSRFENNKNTMLDRFRTALAAKIKKLSA